MPLTVFDSGMIFSTGKTMRLASENRNLGPWQNPVQKRSPTFDVNKINHFQDKHT
jgi:hypothetical protein